MKNFIKYLIISLIAIVITITGLLIYDYQGVKKVAYVQNDKLLSEFTLAKELDEDLEKVRLSRRNELDSLELQMKLLYQAEGESEQLKTLQTQYLEKKNYYNQEVLNLQQSFNEQIEKRLNEYIMAYGKENGYEFIHGASGVGSLLYADESKDITDELIEYVNGKYEGN